MAFRDVMGEELDFLAFVEHPTERHHPSTYWSSIIIKPARADFQVSRIFPGQL